MEKINKNSHFLLIIINYVISNNEQKLYIADSQKKHLFYETLRKIYFIAIFFFIIVSFGLVVIDRANAVKFRNSITLSETFIFFVLLVDYMLWALTHRVRHNGKQLSAFLYPFTFGGIIALLSLFPSFWVINNFLPKRIVGLDVLKSLVFLRLGRILQILSVFKPFEILINALRKQRRILFNVFLFAIILILLFAAIIYNAESNEQPDNLKNYWDAIYFTTITLTTIGFGDIYPVTEFGRIIIIILSLSGIALIAIPSGIIAGAFLEEIQLHKKNQKENFKEVMTKNKYSLKVRNYFYYQNDHDFFNINKYKQKYLLINSQKKKTSLEKNAKEESNSKKSFENEKEK